MIWSRCDRRSKSISVRSSVILRCDMSCSGVVLCCVVLCCVVLYGAVCRVVVWHCLVLCGAVLFCVVLCRVVWYLIYSRR